ncbi:polysaccharide biosynthesis/export family protein [Pseudoruegeria sp. SK021]|uniref:polysaccharide biosynthesis/export family protein n=1 Tax=Pseudoruegeria sp. SK021 TaxID=1933035 RepID=UPI000A264F44|nr:polysaccharide biosynthesis/export family protein [Pseudoruegeria sp. SK021]OSP53869.1 hypothetical protein BV911_15695 [Pseudoruegeria sp. SK021]
MTLCIAAAALSAAMAANSVSADEYRLQAGDVVGMSVAGLPDMNLRSEIQIDGSLSFPLVGVLAAAGLTVAETRSQIQMALATRLLPAYLPDGREVMRMVERDQISASVMEYRPIFVSGDVAQPGELRFRPGMTARQAIAGAGGLAPVAILAPGENPIDLRTDYAGAWYAATAASAKVWRLRRALGEDTDFNSRTWPPAPRQEVSLDEILRAETRLQDMLTQSLVRERAFFERALNQIDDQSAVLRNLLEVEEASELIDADAYAAATAASMKGIYTQARLADMRAAALISSTRRLQTEARLMELERRRTEIARDQERLDDKMRSDQLAELQEAQVIEGRELARLSGAEEKLRSAGLAPLRQPSGGTDATAMWIIRGGTRGPNAASYDTIIQPGDVIEVTQGFELLPLNLSEVSSDDPPLRTAEAPR